jgi:hypothetical protein
MSPAARPRHPTASDLATWRALVIAARVAAGSPQGRHPGLYRAAKRANAAVMPVDHQHPASAFVGLVRLADRFGLILSAERAGPAGELMRLADQVDAALQAPTSERANRVRADIDG